MSKQLKLVDAEDEALTAVKKFLKPYVKWRDPEHHIKYMGMGGPNSYSINIDGKTIHVYRDKNGNDIDKKFDRLKIIRELMNE